MKKIISVMLLFLLLASIVGCSKETEKVFPDETITIICPYGAGGGTDALSRKIAELSSKELGVDVIVVNKTGGGGAVGMGEGAKSDSDGYTVTMATIEAVLLPIAGLAPFQPSDFTPIVRVNFDPASIVVSVSSGYNTLEDLIEDAKNRPGEVNVMTSSFPTNYWLTTTVLEEKAGVKFNKVTAQAGAADQIQNVLGGHVDAITVTPAEAAAVVESGDCKILAIAGEKRDEKFSDVPLMSELGYDIEIGPWRGLLVPKDTPDDVVKVLEDAFTKVVESEELKSFMAEAGFGYAYMNSTDLKTLMDNQTEEYTPIIEKYKN